MYEGLPEATLQYVTIAVPWGNEGGIEGSSTSVVFVRVEKDHGCQCQLCASRRHDATSCVQVRVRTDQVQCDIFTAQYNLFNFSVNKFISSVITNNLRENMYPDGVNPVSRVIQNVWCE